MFALRVGNNLAARSRAKRVHRKQPKFSAADKSSLVTVASDAADTAVEPADGGFGAAEASLTPVALIEVGGSA